MEGSMTREEKHIEVLKDAYSKWHATKEPVSTIGLL
jgi:hypothetical protein